MEDPRIISALFIFLKMAYYNVLINTLPYPHSGTDTKYRSLNLFLFVLQICGYLRFGTICDVKPVCTPYSNPQLVSRKPYITKPCTGIEPACPN